jgi:hypothetical protein
MARRESKDRHALAGTRTRGFLDRGLSSERAKVMCFKGFRCWPSEYVALGELNANDTCVAFESITRQQEGWERDYEVTEPSEASFIEPDR